MQKAEYWIEKLSLQKHPEGGYFSEVYRSTETIAQNALPSRYNGERNFSTSIYFLLKGEEFSCFHRLQTDEVWHFYKGTTLELFILDLEGNLKILLLGDNLEKGEELQTVVPANCWFAARTVDRNSFTLVGCTMAPGFHFDDFEMAEREKLIAQYPQHAKLVETLTYS